MSYESEFSNFYRALQTSDAVPDRKYEGPRIYFYVNQGDVIIKANADALRTLIRLAKQHCETVLNIFKSEAAFDFEEFCDGRNSFLSFDHRRNNSGLTTFGQLLEHYEVSLQD